MNSDDEQAPFAPILWRDALPLIQNYTSNNHPLPISDSNGSTLTSFFIPKAEILRILNQNPNIDAVYFAIAYNNGTLVSTANVGYTLIAFGMIDNKILVGNNDKIWDSQSNQYITLQEAKSLINDFQNGNGNGHRKKVDTTFLNGQTTPVSVLLKGHSIDRSDLDGFFASGNNATTIEFILAYHNSFRHNNNGAIKNVQIGYTLVIVGNTDTNTSTRMTTASDPVYDYCDPCPQVCPKNINELI